MLLVDILFPKMFRGGEESLGLGYGHCRLREVSVKGSDGCPFWASKRGMDEE